MMRKKVLLWVMALSMLMMGVSAYAIPVHFEDGSLKTNAIAVNGVDDVLADDLAIDQASEAVDLKDFQLLSRVEEGVLLIFADGAYMMVPEADMTNVVDQVGTEAIDALGGVEDLSPVKKGGDKDAIKALQESLIALGYLSGTADGSFGGQSASAVSAFEAAMGLKQTGAADELLQLLIASVQQPTVNIVSDYDPAMRYAQLAGLTDVDLGAVAEYGLALDFDDISGTGMLGDATIELDASGEADIDNCFFELHFGLMVKPDADGRMTVEPCVKVSCECVRRPVMQELLIKSGDARCTLALGDLQSALAGAKSVETAVATLDADALQVLANAADAGEFKFRIVGKYDSFDGEAEAEELKPIANVGKAGQVL